MEWNRLRAHYERVFKEAKARGETQESVAKRGGLKNQNLISKMLDNDNLGPQAETFVRAIQGLGMTVSSFFEQIEGSTGTLHRRDNIPPGIDEPKGAADGRSARGGLSNIDEQVRLSLRRVLKDAIGRTRRASVVAQLAELYYAVSKPGDAGGQIAAPPQRRTGRRGAA